MRIRCRYVAHGTGPHMLAQIQQMHQLMHQLMARATPGIAGFWQPPTDVYETEEALVVQADLAGILYGEFRLEVAVITNIRRDDVEASYDNGMLTVVLPKATGRIETSAINSQQPAVPAQPGAKAEGRAQMRRN